MAPALIEPPQIKLQEPPHKEPILKAPEPEHCPGPSSDQAGKDSACATCPNQSICASTPKGPDPDIPLITKRLEDIKHKVLILSGKGGVGKSTFTTLLARAFSSSLSSSGGTVGVMDTDICGPSIPKMLGVEKGEVHESREGWNPVWAGDNLCAMSIQFLLQNRDDAVIWKGAKKTGMIKDFLKKVKWDKMDYLLVDTPPGTTDEHLAVTSFLREAGIDGAVVVTTPQETALLDVRKELDFCRKAGIRVLGVVENMSGFVCGGCGHTNRVFRASTGGGRRLAKEQGVPFLGKVPLDPRIGAACDFGEDFAELWTGTKVERAVDEVVRRVREQTGEI